MEIDSLKALLDRFELGTATAEKDPLLLSAKIETQEFNDLYHDQVDIIRGIKGAGKTALYLVFSYIRDVMKSKNKTICLFGVEASGDPIFRIFKDDFQNYQEIEFENFWSLYFITLIYQEINTPEFRKNVDPLDYDKIDKLLKEMGIKLEKEKASLKDIISSILTAFRQGKLKRLEPSMEVKVNTVSPQILAFKPCLAFEFHQANIDTRPFYISDFKNAIIELLKKNDIRIWIMLDRLDEVFPHRSPLEKYGLKGLLKAAYNFTDPFLRIKSFLRSDIFEYLAEDGFTALTHVMDRCSPPMNWSRDGILQLIMKRISAIKMFVDYYVIDSRKIDESVDYRAKIFSAIFPPKIGRSDTIDWLYYNCADSNKTVTPRDIIDFFKFARANQYEKLKLNPVPQDHLISIDIFKKSLDQLSEHKRNTYLIAEFTHLRKYIQLFEGMSSEYDEKSVQKLVGKDWQKTIAELTSIGFISRIPKSATYRIPVIWRKGLNIKRKKEKAKTNSKYK